MTIHTLRLAQQTTLGLTLMAALIAPALAKETQASKDKQAAVATVQAKEITLTEAWARPTVAAQTAGGGFVEIRNTGKTADRLIAAKSASAERVELHNMSMEGDVMKMRQVDGIDLPAGQTVALKPGGLHLMLMGLKAPLTLGAQVPVTLVFAKAGEVTTTLTVKIAPLAGAAKDEHDGHKH